MQQISVITLGVRDISRSKQFYEEGFGWTPVFEDGEIVFYQMNGFVFGTWERSKLEEDMQRTFQETPGAFTLAHNAASPEAVDQLIGRLAAAGGEVLRTASAPSHGGYRGYVADPDGHAWEIAWNPAWEISLQGHVTFGL